MDNSLLPDELDFSSQMKQTNLDFASKQKQFEIEQKSGDLFNQAVAETAKRNADAWVNDYELSTTAGTLQNLGAAAIEGGARTLGNVAKLPLSLQATELALIPDEDKIAYQLVNEFEAGKREDSPEVQAAYKTLNRDVRGIETDGFDLNSVGGTAGMAMQLGDLSSMNARERIDNALASISEGKKISAAFSDPVEGITNPLNKDIVNEDIAATYDKGVKAFHDGVESYREGNYVSAAGDMVKGAATLLGGLTDLTPEVVATYTAENAAELATGAISRTALALTSAGYAGDVFVDGVEKFQEREGRLPNSAEAASMIAFSAGAGAVDMIADKGLIDAVTPVGKAVAKEVPKEVAKATAKEGVTEAAQTFVEENASSLDFEDIKGKEIYTAGIIGAGVGGGMASTGQAGKLITSSKDAYNAARDTTLSNTKESKASVDKAVETGDFTEVKKNPSAYVDALVKANQQADKPLKEKLSNINEIDTTIQSQLQKVTELAEQADKVKESKGENSKEYKNLSTALDKVTASVRTMREKSDGEKARIIAESNETKPTSTLVKESAEGNTQSTQEAMDTFNVEPSKYSDDELVQLGSSPNLTVNQKTQIENEIEYRQQLKSMGEVSNDVLNGSQGFIGINQYKGFIRSGLANGNLAGATQSLNNLEAFAARHQDKAEMAQAAIAGGRNSQPWQDYKTTYGKEMNSPKLANEIAKESQLLNLAVLQERKNIDSYSQESSTETTPTTDDQTINTTEQEAPTAQTTEPTPTEPTQEPVNETQTETSGQQPKPELGTAEAQSTQKNKLENLPDSLISAFPDMQVTEDQVIPLQQMTAEERVKVKEAGIVETHTDSDGETYEGVNPEYLWQERTRRINEPSKATKKESDVEYNERAERFAQRYDRAAAREEAEGELADQELIDSYKARAAQVRSTKRNTSETGTTSVQATQQPKPELGTVEVQSTVSDNVKTLEGTEFSLGYEGLENIRVTKESSGWKVRDAESGRNLNKSFNSFDEAVAFVTDENNLGLVSSRLDPEGYNQRSQAVFEALQADAKLSVDGLKAAIDFAKSVMQLAQGKITNDQFKSIEDKYQASKALKDSDRQRIEETLNTLSVLPKPVSESTSVAPEATQTVEEVQTPTETVERTDTAVQEESGAGNVLNKLTNDESLPLNEQNLVKKYFTPKKETNSLNQAQDFYEDMYVGSELYEKTFGEDNPETQLASFMGLYEEVAQTVDDLFKEKNTYFKYEDWTQFFAVDGKITDQTKVAMTAGIYNWIVSDANSTLFTDRETVAQLLDTDVVSNKEMEEFMNVGVLNHEVNERVGKYIVQALQLSQSPDAPQYSQSKLAQSLGTFASTVMVKQGLLSMKKVKLPNRKEASTFYRAATLEGNTLDTKLEDIIQVNKGYNQLTKKMFDIDRSRPMPTFEAPTVVVTQVKNTPQKVAKETQEALKAHQEKAHYLKQDNLTVFDFLGLDNQREMNGYIADTNNKMKVNRDGIEGKNQAINRELEDLAAFRESMESPEQAFYFKHEVWKNLRLGMVGAVNPQNSKIHRHLIGMDGWSQEVNKSDEQMVKHFKLAVAEALDLDVDKQTEKTSLDRLDKALSEPVMQNAIAAIRNVLDNNVQDEQATRQAIMDGVKATEMKTHGLDALVNYARFTQPGDTFTADLFREVDGVTNGVAIATIQFAVGTDFADHMERLNRMGMFFDYQSESFGDWKESGNKLDTYQSIAPLWRESIQNQMVNGTAEEKNALTTVIGLVGNSDILSGTVDNLSVSKEERGETKYPLMVLIYGSSEDSVKRSVGEAFVDNAYGKLEKAINKGDYQTVAQVMESFNSLLGSAKYTGHRSGKKPIQDYLNFELGKAEYNKIVSLVGDTYGQTLVDSINSNFSQFTELRQLVNGSANMAYEAYDYMYNREVERLIQEKKDAGEWVEGISDLTNREVDELRSRLLAASPVMDNYFSMKSGQLDQATYTAKTAVERQYSPSNEKGKPVHKDNPYAVQMSFKEAYGSGFKNTISYGSSRVNASPGVAPTVLQVQGMDATAMTLTYATENILGVHDAIGIGLNNVDKSSEVINKHFVESNKEFSILSSAVRTYQRSMGELAKYLDGSDIPENVAKASYKLLAKFMDKSEISRNPKDRMNQLNRLMVELTKDTNEKKAEMFDHLTYSTQYNVEGGGYVLKDTIAENAAKAVEQSSEPVEAVATNQPKSVDQMKRDIPLGSSQQSIDDFNFDTRLQVSKKNAEEVFDDLLNMGNVQENAEHATYLKGIVSEMSNKVLKPFELHLAESDATETIGITTLSDMYIVNQANPQAGQPLSSTLSHGLRMSSVEVYTHEIVHNVTYYGLRKRPALRREAKRLWTQAESVLTPKDLMNGNLQEGDTGYVEELAAATERYNHMFDTSNKTYLDEFVALGTTNENVIKALGGIDTEVTVERGGSIGTRINRLFNKILDLVYGVLTGTRGKTVDKQLSQLMYALAQADARKKNKVIRAMDDAVTFAGEKVNDAVMYGRNKVGQLAESNAVTKSKSGLVKAAGAAVRIVGADNIEYLDQVMEKYVKQRVDTTQGMASVLSSLYTEGKGRTEKNGVFHDLKRIANHNIDQVRKRTMQVTKENINQQFNNLTDANKRVVTLALRTELTSLVDRLGFNTVKDSLTDDKLRADLIKDTENALQEQFGTNGKFYANHARNLGYFMIHEKSLLKTGVLKNAHNIANLFGTSKAAPKDAAKAIPMIDQLAELYALESMGVNDRNELANLLTEETNGMKYVMGMHKGFMSKSTKELEAAHVTKGFVTDLNNPEISYRAGTLDEEAELEAQGYVRGPVLVKDSTDSEVTTMYAYVAKDGGMAAYNAGLVNLMSPKARGTSLYDVRSNANDNTPAFTAKKDLLNVSQQKETLFDRTFGNVEFKAGTYTSPVFNPDGKVTDWNYLMTGNTKDAFLERDTRIDEVLPKMIADLDAKPKVKEENLKVVEAFYEQFKEDYQDNQSNYVSIGPRSQDERYREMYNLMPKQMKEDIRKVWGSDNMLIPKDMVDLTFGYRKYSISDIINKDAESRNFFEKLMNTLVLQWFGKDTASRLRRVRNTERVIQELVAMGKDIWVIKSFVVTLGNTVSNIMLLNARGVSMKDIFYGYSVSVTAAADYKRQVREVETLENELLYSQSLTTRKRKQLKQKLDIAKADLAANPAKELIDNGALQTIVEDVDIDDTSNLTKTIVGEYADKYTKAVPQGIKDAAKIVTLSQGTKGYSFLRDAAQMSDFGARYALFEKLKREGKSTKDAVGEVMDIFIDYDLPTHRLLQYGNDMGLLLFTKYLIRVIKIMYTTMRDYPARVLTQIILQNWLNFNVTDIYDTGLNPLSRVGTSVFEFVDAPGEIATVNAIL